MRFIHWAFATLISVHPSIICSPVRNNFSSSFYLLVNICIILSSHFQCDSSELMSCFYALYVKPPCCLLGLPMPSHSSRQDLPAARPVMDVMQCLGRLTEMCPRDISQLNGSCRYHPNTIPSMFIPRFVGTPFILDHAKWKDCLSCAKKGNCSVWIYVWL